MRARMNPCHILSPLPADRVQARMNPRHILSPLPSGRVRKARPGFPAG